MSLTTLFMLNLLDFLNRFRYFFPMQLLTEEIALVKCSPHAPCPYLSCVITFLQACACGAGPVGMLRRPAHACCMLRPLRAHKAEVLAEVRLCAVGASGLRIDPCVSSDGCNKGLTKGLHQWSCEQLNS